MLDIIKGGPQTLGDGAPGSARGSRDACLVTQDGHSRFTEAVFRGNVYTAADATAVATSNGLSGTSLPMTLYNPKGSGVNAVIWYASLGVIIAPAAGMVVWIGVTQNIANAAAVGTAFSPKNALVGNTRTGAVIASITSTNIQATPVAAIVLGACGTAAASTLGMNPDIGGWIDGALVLAPGTSASFQTSTAATAISVNMGSRPRGTPPLLPIRGAFPRFR